MQEMQGSRMWRCYAALLHSASISNQSLYLDRGVITSQMGGSSAAAFTLHSLSRLFSVSPHLSSALMACLDMVSGGSASGIQCMSCKGVWIWDVFRGGVILSLRS